MLGNLAIFSAIVSSAMAEMRLLKAGDTPDQILKESEFSILSGYLPSDPESVEVDAIIEGAMNYFENKIRIGDW